MRARARHPTTRALVPLALLLGLGGEARGQYATEHCDQAQIQVLTASVSAADFLLENATKYLNRGGVNAEPRPFLLYFGDLGNVAVVAAKIAAMSNELLVTIYDCANDGYCEDESQPPAAWADARQGTIHFCSAYWLEPAVSVDLWSAGDQRSIVVHELSHLPPPPITINYGGRMLSSPITIQQAARLQAVAMPSFAEAYEYFAWHLPLWQPPPSPGNCSLSSRRASSAAAGLMVVGLFLSAVARTPRRRKKMRLTVVMVALALVGLAVVVVRRGAAEDRRPLPLRLTPEAELATVPLRCEVEAPARVELGRPLPVTVRLTNRGTEPLSFWRRGTPWSPRWEPFEVTHDDGQHVPARWDDIGVRMGKPQERGYLRVAPGETVSSTVDVIEQWTLRAGTISVTQNVLADVFTGAFDPQRALLHKQPARLDCPVVKVEVVAASAERAQAR